VENQTDRWIDLRFAVSDTGIGIPSDKLQSIFLPFIQADGTTTRQFGGTGLGLTISKQLVELMGGTIQVQSEVSKGSIFTFTVRLEIQKNPEPISSPPNLAALTGLQKKQPRLNILLAEDNPINQRLAVRLLEKWHHRVTTVSNGKQALAALETASFDLILMDVQMPEMGGIEATTAIRDKEKFTGKHLPIIALTAHAMKGDKEHCLAAGMDGYLTKPIQVEELLNALETIASTSMP
jgi:CheY-like chemotaxis protein